MDNEDETATKTKCTVCRKPYAFDEETDLYENMHDKCGKMKYPLAHAVRRRIAGDENLLAAREIFGPEHTNCVPESMLDDVLADVISMFRFISHEIAAAAGLDEEHYEVFVEPSSDDTTWWAIVKCRPAHQGWVVGGESRVIFFKYIKAWDLGKNNSEKEVEEMLQGFKAQLVDGLTRATQEEGLVAAAMNTIGEAAIRPFGNPTGENKLKGGVLN